MAVGAPREPTLVKQEDTSSSKRGLGASTGVHKETFKPECSVSGPPELPHPQPNVTASTASALHHCPPFLPLPACLLLRHHPWKDQQRRGQKLTLFFRMTQAIRSPAVRGWLGRSRGEWMVSEGGRRFLPSSSPYSSSSSSSSFSSYSSSSSLVGSPGGDCRQGLETG